MVTDGVKYSVPLEEIQGDGPPKDGIPPIDDQKFISQNEANKWLSDNEPGVAVSVGDTHRFYPYQILVWHEIVNNTIDGKAKAYSVEKIKLLGSVEDVFENTAIVLKHDEELDVVRIFKRLPNGSEERINLVSGFWFS